MTNKITDVMIYTRRPLSRAQFEEVSRRVMALRGVVRCERNEARPGLIMVAYDAGRTRAMAVLNKLTRLGYNASLVGI